MDSFSDFVDKVLSWLLLPATGYGACGAFFRCKRNGKSIIQTATEVVGGAVVANVTMPIVAEYAPASTHWTIFFLVGWGGMGLVELAYYVFARGVEVKIRRALGMELPKEDDWDGTERRKDKQ